MIIQPSSKKFGLSLRLSITNRFHFSASRWKRSVKSTSTRWRICTRIYKKKYWILVKMSTLKRWEKSGQNCRIKWQTKRPIWKNGALNIKNCWRQKHWRITSLVWPMKSSQTKKKRGVNWPRLTGLKFAEFWICWQNNTPRSYKMLLVKCQMSNKMRF